MARRKAKQPKPRNYWAKLSEKLDGPVSVLSPKWAAKRKMNRFAYEVIDRHRTRKKRKDLGGTGDSQLTQERLSEIRDIAYDLSRNNPLAVGLLKIDRDGVVGRGPVMQARAKKGNGKPAKTWNEKAEALWKENMVLKPVDTTGRYNINRYVRKAFMAYRQCGDFLTVFTDNGLIAAEGGQIGTPFGEDGAKVGKAIDIINGVAYSKASGKVIGYYVGKPNKWGYIAVDSYQTYTQEQAFFWANPERFSQSRGEPVLTPSIKWIDQLCDYMDAELVAAKVNACYTMFISKNNSYGDESPDAYTQGVHPTGFDEDDNKIEKMEPGLIMYGETGESATGIGQMRPGKTFDPFTQKMLAFIGRPLCMPLMLITGDFSGATFMNARIAYQKAQECWITEQNDILKPFMHRVWRWFIDRMIDQDLLDEREDKYSVDVVCNRWPYVDPVKEAMGDEKQLRNRTITRTIICARQGYDFEDVVDGLAKENEVLEAAGLNEKVPAVSKEEPPPAKPPARKGA